MEKLMNIKIPVIFTGFFLASVGFFLCLMLKVDSSPVILLILAISGFGVLILWLIIILNYIKSEAAIVMKSNEMAQKNSNDEKQKDQYKDGIDLRIKEAEFNQANNEFNHAKEILKLLVELRKDPSGESNNPTAEDVKKLKEYFEKFTTLLNQIKEIVKTN
jgi:hypothetical protein